MADIDSTIRLDSNSKLFNFRAVSDFKVKKLQNVISVPFIATTPSNTVLFRFSGQMEEVTFSFALFDNDVDVSGGTEPGGVKTIVEQIAYLKDTIFVDDYDATWSLLDNRYYTSYVTGVIVNLDLDSKEGSPTIALGSITFVRGRRGAL